MGAAGDTAMGMWGDYDNDGYLDLFVVRGQLNNYANLLFRNNGDGTFTQVKTGSLANDLGRSPTCAWGDYDNDGFLDLFVPRRAGQQNLLYHNNGNSNHWLLVKLAGTTSNRAAIGAKVRATAIINGRRMTQMREISGGNRAQNDLRAHFGLGNATSVMTLQVEWPSGTVQVMTNLLTNQILTIIEPRRPVLACACDSDGSFVLSVTTDPEQEWRLESSVDLITWTPVTDLLLKGSTELIEQPPLPGARFYRVTVVSQP